MTRRDREATGLGGDTPQPCYAFEHGEAQTAGTTDPAGRAEEGCRGDRACPEGSDRQGSGRAAEAQAESGEADLTRRRTLAKAFLRFYFERGESEIITDDQASDALDAVLALLFVGDSAIDGGLRESFQTWVEFSPEMHVQGFLTLNDLLK